MFQLPYIVVDSWDMIYLCRLKISYEIRMHVIKHRMFEGFKILQASRDVLHFDKATDHKFFKVDQCSLVYAYLINMGHITQGNNLHTWEPLWMEV